MNKILKYALLGAGGITVPMHISGTFTDLKYTLDYGAMVSEAVNQKVESRKEEFKNSFQEQLKDKLKGLLK